jgi:hypothetical protein
MPRQDDIRKLIMLYNRRLQKLREQEAVKGINAPPEILIEIEDIEDKLVGLQAELETASNQPISSLTDDDITKELARLSDDKSAPSSSTQIGGFNLSNVSGSNITIGNVSADVSAGGDIVGSDKIIGTAPTTPTDDSFQMQLETALVQWRQEVRTIIDGLDDEDDREYATKITDKVIEEAKKGKIANPNKLAGFFKRLNNIAPDTLEVTMTALGDPFKGIGLVLEETDNQIKLEKYEDS